MILLSLDTLALIMFFGCWIGAHLWNEGYFGSQPRVSSSISDYRRRWMGNMVVRELRMVDTMIQGTLLNGVAFFASTSILLAGGALTVLGATDKAIELVSDLPIVDSVSATLWEIKVLLLVFVFTYAFFKFAWCYRLFIYVVIIIGAAPPAPVTRPIYTDSRRDEPDETDNTGDSPPVDTTMIAETTAIKDEPDDLDPLRAEYATRAANLHDLGARHFNRGLRAYMFAVAAIAWFFHPVALIFSSILVMLVLYRREFRSRSLTVLGQGAPDITTLTRS